MASNVFHQLYYHITWSTKGRLPLLLDKTRPAFIPFIEEDVIKRGGKPLVCNAMPDHVHLLVDLPPTVCIATFIGQIKGSSSFAANRHLQPSETLQWQEGYAVVTLRTSDVAVVVRYIANQVSIHAQRGTQGWLQESSWDDRTDE